MADRTTATFQRGPLVGIRKFRDSIDISAPALQRALLGAILARSRLASFTGINCALPYGLGRVHVFGNHQWDIEFKNGNAASGDDLLALIGALFSVPAGVAALRILEAATGAQLDAHGAINLVAAVDSWVDRGSPKNEGRRA